MSNLMLKGGYIGNKGGMFRSPIFVGGTSQAITGSTTTNTTITLNSGLTGGISSTAAEGDLIVIAYGTGSLADRTLSIISSNYITLADLYANDTNDTNFIAAVKILTAADVSSGVTVSATGATADSGAVVVHIWRYITNNISLITATNQTGINTNFPSFDSVTTIYPSTIVIYAAAGCAPGVSWTTTNQEFIQRELNNFIQQVGSASTYDVVVGMGSILIPTISTYQASSWTARQASSTSASFCSSTITVPSNLSGIYNLASRQYWQDYP